SRRRKCGRACLSSEDGQPRSANAVPPPWESRGILSRMDQKQVGPAAVSRARAREGANGNAVGLPHLQLAALDSLEEAIQRCGKLETPQRQILSDRSERKKEPRSASLKEKRHQFLHSFNPRMGHPAAQGREHRTQESDGSAVSRRRESAFEISQTQKN